MNVVGENHLIDKIQGKMILLGKRAIVKMGRNRYFVYLPTPLNKLWKTLHEEGRKVLVYIEISEDEMFPGHAYE